MVLVLRAWRGLAPWETRRGHIVIHLCIHPSMYTLTHLSKLVWSPRIEGVIESWGLASCGRVTVPEGNQERRLLVKVKPSCRGDPSILDISWDDHRGQQQLWSGADLSFRDKLCVLWMAELSLVRWPWEARGSWVSSRCQALNSLHCWLFTLLDLGFNLIVTVPWFSLVFDFTGVCSHETLNILETLEF